MALLRPVVVSYFGFCHLNTRSQSSLRGRKGLFGLHMLIKVHHWGKSGLDLKEEQRGRNHEAMQLTGLLSRLKVKYVSYTCQDHLPRGSTTHSGLGLSTSFKKTNHRLQASLIKAFS